MAAISAARISDLMATRLYLDGQWSLDEFEVLFRSFNDLYRLIAAFTAKTKSVNSFVHVPVPFHRRRLNRVAHEQEIAPLRVLQFSYSSPGHLDLLGLGKVAEVVKDTLFGVADRIIESEDRELGRNKKLLENLALQAKISRETEDSAAKRTNDAALHNLAIAEKKIANDRATVALATERLEAATKEIAVFREMLALARESGASDEDISKISAGFLSKVVPVVPLIREGKLLANPPTEERNR